MIQQDLRDQETVGAVDIETGEAISQQILANEISSEVDNLAHLADDDDYGDRDGDEGF